MSSDDDLSSVASIPEARIITSALRSAVQKQFEEDASKATVKAIRARVEGELSLFDGFFKRDPHWKLESKLVIEDEAQKQNSLLDPPTSPRQDTPEGQPLAKVAGEPAKKQVKRRKREKYEPTDSAAGPPKKSTKRGKAAPTTTKSPPARKSRSRPTVAEDDDEEDPETHAMQSASGGEPSNLDAPPKGSVKRQNASPSTTATPRKAERAQEEIMPGGDFEETDKGKPTGQEEASGSGRNAGSDSEMSEVLDPTPQKKMKPQNSTADSSKKPKNIRGGKSRSKEKSKKGSSKVESSLSPDEEQIKLLQGWLLKCGIRKFWSKELAKFDSPKEKIKHLRGLLTDAGMAGRYSNEKARKIKEARELQAEVEAVQAGANEWGRDGNTRANTRSSRNAPVVQPEEKKQIRGMEDLAFLDDQSDSD